jgi:hypothetical protein
MKQKIRKGLLYLILGFVAMFLVRLTYGYLTPTEQAVLSAVPNAPSVDAAVFGNGLITSIGGRAALKNYATEKLKVQREGTAQASSVDQKYEKVASVVSQTNAFEEDERKTRDAVKTYNALIQFEQSSGLSGSRRIELAIGVPPDRFDPMVGELKRIGELSSIRIDKADKTNEYKELKAKRASLEKTRDALIGLKSKGGRIEEFTNLENRILEIDEQMQSTGVQLGDYDQENEFCTVKLALKEKGAAIPGISFRHRAIVALAWTIRYYTFLLAFLIFGALLTLLVVVILQRLNVISPPASQLAGAEE